MFICIGENENQDHTAGIGDTLEEAIRDWAYDSEYMQEFVRYNPNIFEGKALKVKVKTEIVIESE